MSEPHSRTRRRPVDLMIGIGALLILLALSTFAADRAPSRFELQLFRDVNGLPDWLFPFIWPFMQYGVIGTIPTFAAIALVLRRYRLALMLLVGGIGIYLLALVVKGYVDRGRPSILLDAVHARETFRRGSLGYPSGHTAVGSVISTVGRYYVPRTLFIASLGLLCIVTVGRMYVAAHLPFDVIGGICLGTSVGSLLNFAVGVPANRRPAVAGNPE